MPIQYEINENINPELFRQLLMDADMGEQRPVNDLHCIKGMVENSNLIISAWRGDQLVGVARSVTDFHYCCFLSDLVVHKGFQKQGIGKQLQVLTQERLDEHCKLILIAAPATEDYFQHVGYEVVDQKNNGSCWVIAEKKLLK